MNLESPLSWICFGTSWCYSGPSVWSWIYQNSPCLYASVWRIKSRIVCRPNDWFPGMTLDLTGISTLFWRGLLATNRFQVYIGWSWKLFQQLCIGNNLLQEYHKNPESANCEMSDPAKNWLLDKFITIWDTHIGLEKGSHTQKKSSAINCLTYKFQCISINQPSSHGSSCSKQLIFWTFGLNFWSILWSARQTRDITEASSKLLFFKYISHPRNFTWIPKNVGLEKELPFNVGNFGKQC